MNTNAIHNALNIIITVISALGVFDWTSVGLEPQMALKIVAGLALIKLVINGIRDGITGMVKNQPPVS